MIDEEGINVWANWDSPTDYSYYAPAMMNVAMELDCLHPKPDNLFMGITDEENDLALIALWSGEAIFEMDLEQITILFMK